MFYFKQHITPLLSISTNCKSVCTKNVSSYVSHSRCHFYTWALPLLSFPAPPRSRLNSPRISSDERMRSAKAMGQPLRTGDTLSLAFSIFVIPPTTTHTHFLLQFYFLPCLSSFSVSSYLFSPSSIPLILPPNELGFAPSPTSPPLLRHHLIWH